MTFLFGGNRKNLWSEHVTRGMHRKIVATWSVVRDRTRSRSSIGERVCKCPFLLFCSTSCSKLADLLTCREDMFRWNMKGNFYEQSRIVHKIGVFLCNKNICLWDTKLYDREWWINWIIREKKETMEDRSFNRLS